MTTLSTEQPQPDAVGALARAHSAVALATALFAHLDEDGRSADASAVERLLVASGVSPTSVGPQRVPQPSSRSREDRYKQGRSYKVTEVDTEEVIAGEPSAETLAAALVMRLHTDGHVELATRVAAALRIEPFKEFASLQEAGEPAIDFAILTVIEVERRAVCDAFGLTSGHRVRKGSRVYWRGRLALTNGDAYELVVAQAPDAANVDAAILTNDLVHHWQPSSALLVGIAASTDPSKAGLGDVVLGSDVYYYERGKETLAGRKPEPKIISADATLWSNVTAVPDWDGSVASERPDRTQVKPRIHQGVIASGEKVIADAAARDQIAGGHRKILALEMEGYGFSRAIWQSSEHVRHLDIRGICDDGSKNKDDRWHHYAAAAAAAFARHFLLDRPLPPRGRQSLLGAPLSVPASNARLSVPNVPSMSLPLHEVELTIAFKLVAYSPPVYPTLHHYELRTTIKNTGPARINEWYLEIEFPTRMLEPDIALDYIVPNRSTHESTFLRLVMNPLHSGDEHTNRLLYRVDNAIYDQGTVLFAKLVRARVFVNGALVREVERPFRDLQNF